MTPTFKVEGFSELDAALSDLPKATARNVVKRVLIKIATPIARDFASRVTVLTGRLQRGIGVGTKLSRRQARLARKIEGKSAVEVYVGAAPVKEATLEEFGSEHNAPKPALRPAWDAGKDRALDRLGPEMWAEIKTVSDRAARKQARLIAKNGG